MSGNTKGRGRPRGATRGRGRGSRGLTEEEPEHEAPARSRSKKPTSSGATSDEGATPSKRSRQPVNRWSPGRAEKPLDTSTPRGKGSASGRRKQKNPKKSPEKPGKDTRAEFIGSSSSEYEEEEEPAEVSMEGLNEMPILQHNKERVEKKQRARGKAAKAAKGLVNEDSETEEGDRAQAVKKTSKAGHKKQKEVVVTTTDDDSETDSGEVRKKSKKAKTPTKTKTRTKSPAKPSPSKASPSKPSPSKPSTSTEPHGKRFRRPPVLYSREQELELLDYIRDFDMLWKSSSAEKVNVDKVAQCWEGCLQLPTMKDHTDETGE